MHSYEDKRYVRKIFNIDIIKNIVRMHPIVVLSILIMGTVLFVFHPFLFERQIFVFSDIGTDTQHIYYPFFVSISRKIQEGDFSLWDFTYGTGVNILTRQADVGSIFTYLTCALGTRGIKYALVLVHILKVFVSGYLCYFYLCNFNYGTLAKIVVSYVFAFNGFMMLWGQHYFFGTACICIILMLWAIELTFRSPKGYIFAALSTFVVMCTSYYYAYMVLLFSGIYVLLRMAYIYSFKDIKKIIKVGAGLLAAVFLGACLAAFIFIPSVYIVTSTSARLGNDVSFFDKIIQFITTTYDRETIRAIVSRMFSNNLMGTEDFVGPWNYYELPQWFFTSFNIYVALIFVSEIILCKNESIKRKLIKAFCVLIFVYTMFYPFISFVFNGFVGSFFRYTYLFMPILGLCYASVLEKIFGGKLSYAKPQILISGIISLIVLAKSIYMTYVSSGKLETAGRVYLIITVLFVICSLLVQGQSKESARRNICILCSVVLVAVNVGMESYETNNERTFISEVDSKIYATSGNDAVRAAIVDLNKNDTTFYRIEKTFRDFATLNDSLLEGYYSISTYNSVINKNLIEFKNQICPEYQATAAEGYYDFRKIVKDVDVVSLLGVKYILSLDYINDVPEYKYLKTIEGIHIYQNTATDGIAKFFANAMDYEKFLELDQDTKEKLIKDTLIIHGLEESSATAVVDEKSTISLKKPKNSSCVEGSADIKQEGWVFVAIPYEEGWKAYVDGEEVEILQADVGFSAIKLSEGHHEFSFKYNTPYLRIGVGISCVAGITLALWGTGISFHKKKQRKCACR